MNFILKRFGEADTCFFGERHRCLLLSLSLARPKLLICAENEEQIGHFLLLHQSQVGFSYPSYLLELSILSILKPIYNPQRITYNGTSDFLRFTKLTGVGRTRLATWEHRHVCCLEGNWALFCVWQYSAQVPKLVTVIGSLVCHWPSSPPKIVIILPITASWGLCLKYSDQSWKVSGQWEVRRALHINLQ